MNYMNCKYMSRFILQQVGWFYKNYTDCKWGNWSTLFTRWNL